MPPLNLTCMPRSGVVWVSVGVFVGVVYRLAPFFRPTDKKFAKRLGGFFCVRSEGILVGLPHFGGRCFVGVFSG